MFVQQSYANIKKFFKSAGLAYELKPNNCNKNLSTTYFNQIHYA